MSEATSLIQPIVQLGSFGVLVWLLLHVFRNVIPEMQAAREATVKVICEQHAMTISAMMARVDAQMAKQEAHCEAEKTALLALVRDIRHDNGYKANSDHKAPPA